MDSKLDLILAELKAIRELMAEPINVTVSYPKAEVSVSDVSIASAVKSAVESALSQA